MRIFNYSEARQNFSSLLNTALKEEVIITRKDGSRFRVVPMDDKKEGKSPLEGIQGVKTNISSRDLVKIIREGREGRDRSKEKD